MKYADIILFIFVMCNVISPVYSENSAGEVIVYRGDSDVSAAVAIDKDMFIVADDEQNVLRVYRTTEGGLPLLSRDITEFLDIEQEHPEADIEGATTIGNRIYWITSHGRNKDGKMRPNRYRFFATDIKIDDGNITIEPAGKPYKTLIHKLVKNKNTFHLGLDIATRLDADELSKKERQKLAPKEEGLNIEGLCASPDGRVVYIGFRNPRPVNRVDKRAKTLIVPLNNPKEVIENSDVPIFGEPILLDLGGRGIRSMEYSHFHEAYFIIAGSSNESRQFALYRWSGKKEIPPVLVKELVHGNFNPETLITFRESNKFFLLSDDGTLEVKVSGAWECMEGEFRKDGTCLNKYLKDPMKKSFRGMWLEI